jgi:hypothetical protein
VVGVAASMLGYLVAPVRRGEIGIELQLEKTPFPIPPDQAQRDGTEIRQDNLDARLFRSEGR